MKILSVKALLGLVSGFGGVLDWAEKTEIKSEMDSENVEPDYRRGGMAVVESFERERDRLNAMRLDLYAAICASREKYRQLKRENVVLREQCEGRVLDEQVAEQNRELLIELLTERSSLLQDNNRLNRDLEGLQSMLQFAEALLAERRESSSEQGTVVLHDSDSDAGSVLQEDLLCSLGKEMSSDVSDGAVNVAGNLECASPSGLTVIERDSDSNGDVFYAQNDAESSAGTDATWFSPGSGR